MPGYRGHLVGAVILFLLTLACVLHVCSPTFLTIIEWCSCMLAGSLFPDIDIKSKGQRFFYLVLLVVFTALIITQRYKALSLISLVSVVPLVVHHRGICHRVWFVVAVPCMTALLLTITLPTYRSVLFIDAVFFSAGAISHVWLDMGFKRMMRW